MTQKFVFLTSEFYEMCTTNGYKEIECKANRPYILLLVKVRNQTWGLPLRSHINHKFAFMTNKEKGCGVDYSKAVVVNDAAYIDQTRKPHIREDEFKALKGKEHQIRKGFESYIKRYEKARRDNQPRDKRLLEYSTLQNYESFLNIEQKP